MNRPMDVVELTGAARGAKQFRPVRLDGVTVLVPEPDVVPSRVFVGRERLVAQCMAAWLPLDGSALHFRLSGPPGVGKNALVYHLARDVEKKPIYVMLGHEELTPEDVAATARITSDHRVEYVGSPLLAAMLSGGICFFDEIGKVPSRALSLLASVLDERRTLTSVLAGFSVRASPEFRFCAAMNDADADTGGLPGYIDERLRPVFRLGYPPLDEVLAIVDSGGAPGRAILLARFRLWASKRDTLSPRTALNLIGYAARLAELERRDLTAKMADALIELAAEQVHD